MRPFTRSNPSDRPGAASLGRAGAIGLLLCLAGAAGCASDDSARATADDPPPLNTGLAQFDDDVDLSASLGGRDFDEARSPDADPPARDDVAAIFERDAALLPSLASGEIGGAPEPAASEQTQPPPVKRPEPIVADASPVRTNLRSGVALEADEQQSTDPSNAAADAPTSDRQAAADLRIAELADELGSLLRERAERSDDPFAVYARLAALEAVLPGSLNGPSAIPSLTPREADQLTAWRDLLRTLGEGLASESGSADSSVEALASAVARAQSRMATHQSLSIESLELCTRVDGYGVFTPIPSPRLLAGRAHRAIVYLELDNFAHSAASGPGGSAGYKVALEQSLELFHDADGVLAWRTPAETVADFSRNRRKEFYTVQIIELPATLSVGAYRLKAVVEDEATGAVAERIIPIEIVADPALAQGAAD